MTNYRDAILARWPKMQTQWVDDLADLMQQVTEAQSPEMEKDLRAQLASERTGRDEYAIENHRLRTKMAEVEAEMATLKALTSPPVDEIAAILYPSASTGRRGFAKAVNTVADWLDVVAPEVVAESGEQTIIEPALVVDTIEATETTGDQAAEVVSDEPNTVGENSAS